MSWSNDYVGIPYLDLGRDRAGCDCWGLARMIYAGELQIDLPSYAHAYSSASEAAEVSALLAGRETEPWSRVDGLPHQFDLLLLRIGRHDIHVGVALNDRLMLHMAGGCSAKIESFAGPAWRDRFVDAYRHTLSPVNDPLKVTS